MAWSHDNSSGGERRENLIYALALPGFTNFFVFLVAAPPKPALSATPLRRCIGGTSADAPASSVIAARTRMLLSVTMIVYSNAANEQPNEQPERAGAGWH